MGAHLPATAANVSNMKLSDKTFAYSITKGAILDVSLTGERCLLCARVCCCAARLCLLCRFVGLMTQRPGQQGTLYFIQCLTPASKRACACSFVCGLARPPLQPGSACRRLSTESATPGAALHGVHSHTAPPPCFSAGLNYATDPAMNKAFYGNRGVTPQSILDGAVEPPEPMGELYAALDKARSRLPLQAPVPARAPSPPPPTPPLHAEDGLQAPGLPPCWAWRHIAAPASLPGPPCTRPHRSPAHSFCRTLVPQVLNEYYSAVDTQVAMETQVRGTLNWGSGCGAGGGGLG